MSTHEVLINGIIRSATKLIPDICKKYSITENDYVSVFVMDSDVWLKYKDQVLGRFETELYFDGKKYESETTFKELPGIINKISK